MYDRSLLRIGAAACAGAALLYVVFAALQLLLPPESYRGQMPPREYWAYLLDHAGVFRLRQYVGGAASLFAAASAVAIAERLRGHADGWIRISTTFVVIGFGVMALSSLRYGASYVQWGHMIAQGDDATVAAVLVADRLVNLDSENVICLGAIGLWTVVANLVALRAGSAAWPRRLAQLGLALGAMYWLALLAWVPGVKSVYPIAVGAAGVVLGPIWYLWMSRVLWSAAAAAPGETV